jgi:ferredoxin
MAKIKRLKLKKDLCIGCGKCGKACAANKQDIFYPEYTMGGVNCSEENHINDYKELPRINIKKNKETGEITDKFCILCGKCAKVCPVGAIKVEDKLVLDFDQCIGCRLCADACPKGAIHFGPYYPRLCDTCGGNPSCVAACPKDALSFE